MVRWKILNISFVKNPIFCTWHRDKTILIFHLQEALVHIEYAHIIPCAVTLDSVRSGRRIQNQYDLST